MDGQDRLLVTEAAPIRNQHGQIEGVVATSHEVTALRKAEQATVTQQRQLQALLALTSTALTHVSKVQVTTQIEPLDGKGHRRVR